jgi:hypothetical protein
LFVSLLYSLDPLLVVLNGNLAAPNDGEKRVAAKMIEQRQRLGAV